MTPEKICELSEAQLRALQKRLESGRPLTTEQMRFVERHLSKKESVPGEVATSVASLAKILNVTRQLIYAHRDKVGAPSNLNVEAWRNYLLSNGRGDTVDRLSSHPCSRESRREAVEDATGFQFEQISNQLPTAIRAALEVEGVKLPSEKIDRITFKAWLLLAAAQQSAATRQGIDGIFDGDEGEEIFYPVEIVAVCDRI